MSADSSSRIPMWSLAIRRKRLNHWSKGSFSDRLECHGSGWIPDLTRCDANQGFRIWFAVSVSRDSNASGLADCSRQTRISSVLVFLTRCRHSSRIAHTVCSVQVGCLLSTEPRSLDVARPCHGESGISHGWILQTLNIPAMLRFRILPIGWTNSSDVNQEKD
jgi:hypothetical protein